MRDATEVKPCPHYRVVMWEGYWECEVCDVRFMPKGRRALVSWPSRKDVEALDRFHTDSDGCMVHDDEGDYLDRVEVLALFPPPSLPVERGEG